MMEFTTTGSSRYRVFYDSWMDGGGTWFGQEYIDIIKQRYPQQFERCYEWCSGPGYIGFSLLDHGVCQSLCVSDIYDLAINKAVAETIKQNQLTNVNAYHTGQVAGLPEHEKFDLVVSNPPHFLECPGDDNYQRIAVDVNWTAHQEFFANIRQHLLPNGIILLQENQAGSLRREAEFEQYINAAGLEITDVFNSPEYYTPDHYTQIYYIEIRQK